MPQPDRQVMFSENPYPGAFPRVVRAAQADDALQSLLRELIDEISGLRKDLRREVLQREIGKLPKPIRA